MSFNGKSGKHYVRLCNKVSTFPIFPSDFSQPQWWFRSNEVSRTFSKTWGFPSLRLGYLLSTGSNVSALTCVRGPYETWQPITSLEGVRMEEMWDMTFLSEVSCTVEFRWLLKSLRLEDAARFPVGQREGWISNHGEDINQLAVVGILAALKQRDYVFEYVREVMEPWCNGSVAGDGPIRHLLLGGWKHQFPGMTWERTAFWKAAEQGLSTRSHRNLEFIGFPWRVWLCPGVPTLLQVCFLWTWTWTIQFGGADCH